MRILNYLLAVMFLGFAFLQVNDPDPILWILIYGAMAVVCIMAAFRFYVRRLLIGLALVYLAFCVYYFPGVQEWLSQEDRSELFDDLAKMEHWYIEEAREFIGLLICLTVLVFQYFRSLRKI